MAKIKLEIDTETTELGITRKVQVVTHPKIRVISAISISQLLQDAFTSGVSNNNADIKFFPGNGYKKNDIRKLKTVIHNNNSADLIVTAGGLAPYQAASSDATISFVCVTGAVPSNPTGNYKGCTSLESANSNGGRINILLGKNFALSEIGLFYNPNSYMTSEVGDWNNLVGTNTQVFVGGNDSNGDNNSAAYATDFTAAKIPTTIKALVVSGDPFFQDTKELLIGAANAWIAAAPGGVNRYVCYPTQDYSNTSGTRPTANHATLYGPDLATAYNLLGQVAAVALTGAPPLNIRLQNIRHDL
jgi:hypothetical protein